MGIKAEIKNEGEGECKGSGTVIAGTIRLTGWKVWKGKDSVFGKTSECGDLDSGSFLMEEHQMDRDVIWGNREASVATLG
jgi:hypothetical protein